MRLSTVGNRFTPVVLLAVLSLLLSLFASAAPVLGANKDGKEHGNQDPPATGTIAVFKTMCDQIGTQDTCTGRDTSLSGYSVDFQIRAGTATSGTLLETLTVVLSQNDNGQGNTGAGSQGRNTSTTEFSAVAPNDVYTVCEVPLAYKTGSASVVLDPEPRPTASGGGSSGGGNQQQTPNTDNCITVTLTGGTAELKFLDMRGPQISVIKTGDTLGKVTDAVDYSVTITNNSQFTVYKQSITDSLKGSLTADLGCGTSLAAGASCTINYSYTVQAGDADPLLNTATAVYDRNAALTGLEGTATDGHSVNLFQPSIRVLKTATPDPVLAGGSVAYVITIDNTSSADSPPLVFDTISDSLKGDLKSSCPASLAHDAANCVITYTLSAGTTLGQRCNDVSVSSHPQGFTNNITGSARACVQVASPAALVVEKTPDEDTTAPIDLTANDVTAGNAATFTIVTRNTGGVAATGVKLSDLLPAVENGWTIGAATTWPAGDSGCVISGIAPAAQTLTCGGTTGVTIAAGGSLSVTLTTTTDGVGADNDCGELSNLAANATSTNAGTATDAGEIDVLCPNPSVTKTATSASVDANDAVGFSITVNGGGTGSATNVTLKDTVPAGHTWTVGGANIGSCSVGETALTTGAIVVGGLEIVCNFGTMTSSDSKTITVSSTSTPADCAEGIANTATITAGGDVDISTASNSDAATVTVNCPNVSVSKSASASTVQAPGTLTYTILGSNAGSGAATGVVITDDLDDDLVVTSATFDVDPDTAGGTGTCSVAPSTNGVTCTIGALAASDGNTTAPEPDSVRVTIVTTAPTAACGTVSNRASISATNEGAGASENNQSATVNVNVLCPDVSIDKSVNGPVIVAGSSATFTITASGGTQGTSSDVTLTDTVPTGFTWTVGGAAIGDCKVGSTTLSSGATVSGGQIISCNFGPLGANQTRSISVSATPGTASCAATVTNTAVVTAGGDTDTSNNSDLAQFTVRCPTLVIDKVASTETITISGPNGALVATPSVVTWTLSYTVTNGPVTGVVITDPIPTGFVFLDATNGGTATSGVVTWNLGTVTASGSVSFRTTVNPTTIPRTGQANVATIDSNETAPDEGQDGVTVAVLPPPLGSTGGPSPTATPPLGSTGGPSPTATPPPGAGLPNTAASFVADSEPMSGLVALLAALAVAASVGASMFLGVRASSRRRR